MYKILMCGLGNNYGGVEAYIMSVFRNINKEIFHIDFINCQKTEDIVCHDEINSFNCKIFRLYGKKAWKVFFKQHKGEYDAIIFNLLATFFQPIELCVRWGGFKAVIVHSHNSNLDFSWYEKPFFKLFLKYEHKKLSKLEITKWACSDKAAQWMFGDKSEYEFIKNGIDVSNFKFNKQVRDKIRLQLSCSNSDFVIGHCGRFAEQKNQEYLIDIFIEYLRIDSNAKLLLIGPMLDTKIKEKVLYKIESNGLKDKVLLLGAIRDVASYYNAMDIFVLPSRYEGLPIVAIEAQASGLPCIFSNEITEQCSISNYNSFESINNIDDWVSSLKYYKDNYPPNRNDSYLNVINEGFIMAEEIKHIQNALVRAIEYNN